MLTMSVDPLNSLWTDPRFGTDVASRFASIMVKGFSVTRQILGVV